MICLLNSLYIILINIIFVLISVAFLTLLERKILGYVQLRKGPNKISFIGLLQPFSDAIKLFNKENFMIMKSNYYMYLLSPMLMLILMLMIWLIMPFYMNLYSFNLSLIYLFCILSLGVYMMMIAGWSSNSIYSLIGSLRSIAQTISYEVSLIMIFLGLLLLNESFNIYEFYLYQKSIMNLIIMFPNMLMMLVSLLAELNRTPFDFAEGESELVSGFNIEYMSGLFAMIFISEYGMILFFSYLMTIMFLFGNFMNLFFYLKMFLSFFLIIWIRGTYPRFRYDNLMYLIWKYYLIYSLMILIFMMMIKLLIMMM